MAELRYWTWLTVVTLGYVALTIVVGAMLDLEGVGLAILVGVVALYAICAQLFPRPWRP